MKKNAIILMLILILMLTASCGKKPQDKTVTAPIAKVKQTVDAFGVIKVKDQENITIDFAATVKNIYVKEGQWVKKGDPLVQLDVSDYLAQVSSKASEVRIAQLDLLRTKNTNRGDIAEIKSIQKDLSIKLKYLKSNNDPDMQKALGSIVMAKAIYTKALQDLAIKQALYKENAISKTEIDDFNTTVEAKKRDLNDAKSTLENIKYSKQKEIDQLQTSLTQKLSLQDGSSQSQIEKINQMQTELTLAKEKLNKNFLKENNIICNVPNGVVFDVGYVAGDIVGQSKKVLSILNLDSMVVAANVPEEFIKDVKLGAEVSFSPQADKTKVYKGKVTYISNNAITVNGETDVPVEISIINRDAFLLPNFNVDLKISE